MGMRVTTGMMMNTYRYNLQGSTSNLSDARNKVLSQRKFDSYAEDPSAATMAWRIRRAMYSNADYQINNDDTYSRFNIAWTTMGVVNDQLSDKDGRFSTIRALTDSTASGRQPLGQVLSNGAETIVQAMNSAKQERRHEDPLLPRRRRGRERGQDAGADAGYAEVGPRSGRLFPAEGGSGEESGASNNRYLHR